MERARLRSRKSPAFGQPPQPETERRGTPATGVRATNTGPLATAAWLVARNIYPTERTWYVEISLYAEGVRFDIEIFAEEWGFAFHRDDQLSWIRVTDIPFVHGRDDFDLLGETSSLRDIGRVVQLLENRFHVAFDREGATIRTSLSDSEAEIREWIATL